MSALVIRRTIQAVPTLLVVSFIMFIMLAIGPNPLELLKQNPSFTDKDVKRLTQKYGWDRPWYEQYGGWVSGIVKGDFGESVVTQRPAGQMIRERLPVTLMLTGMSMVFSLMVAIPIGAYVAVKKYSKADYAATFTTFIMMATPSFFLALLLQLFALKLQDTTGSLIFYTGGAPTNMGNPVEVFQRMALPVTALSMLQIAGWSRYQRSELLNVLNSEYIKCAMAKGMPARHVFMKHAMRNTLLPIITIVAIDVATLFGGAVITETIFGLPGMGTLLLDSVFARDTTVVLGIVMIGAFLMVLFNTIADILYGVLDPRVRVG